MNKAQEFNNIRRIIFSTFHKTGSAKAFEYLEGYKKKLGLTGYSGLRAELNFYKDYLKEFKLTVGADVGDHTDFSGSLGSEVYRFDVTTNLDYKKLKDYEPLQKSANAKYKIALVKQNGDLDELIDINFPFCTDCEEGRLMDIGILLGANYNSHGENQSTNDQVLIGACSHCDYYQEQKRISTHFLLDYETEIRNELDNDYDRIEYLASIGKKAEFNIDKVVSKHTNNVLPYLHTQFDKILFGLGERNYNITDPRDGDGYFYTKLRWRKDLKIIQDYIRDEYDFEIN